MAYCKHCGSVLKEEAKFCGKCGSAVGNDVECTSNNTTVNEGKLHVCPACGKPINAFTGKCIACGTEFRDTKSSLSVREFSEKLANSFSERNRINIIRSFPVPNTREDILEFFIIAKSNFDAKYYINHLDVDDISDAWLTKIEQCYDKAELIFDHKSQEFVNIKGIYDNIKSSVATQESKYITDKKKEEVSERRNVEAKDFKNSKSRKALIALMVLSIIFIISAFSTQAIASGVVGVVALLCGAIAFLMGSNIIKIKSKRIYFVVGIIGWVLFVVTVILLRL